MANRTSLCSLSHNAHNEGMILPSCQDTGTAIVMGKKGQYVWTNGNDEEAISRGVFKTYTETNLRYSQMAPLDMYKEVNTGSVRLIFIKKYL